LRELRNIRLRRGLSQADLSAGTGVAEYTISEIEAGKRTPRPSTLRKLAQGLGVKVADLYGEADNPLAQAPATEQPSFDNHIRDERQAEWDAAVRRGRRLRETGRDRLEELLAAWHESKERGEDSDARRAYLDEIGELLQHAYDAEMALWSALRTNRLDQVDLEEFAEVQAADRLYLELFRLVETAGLSVRPDGAQEGEPAQAGQPEAEAHTVEESEAA
jgi:transcriptional regulator with XRE-family HTH domain